MSTSVANVTSHFPDAENGFSTTTSGSVSSGAATVGLNSTGGYTNGEPVVLVIDPTDATLKQTFTGIIDTGGVQVTSVVWTAGTNTSHAAGATVVDYATATHIAMISKGIKVEHKQTGKHGAVTADSLATDTISESTNGAGVTIDSALIKDGKVYGSGVYQAVHIYTANDTWTKPTGLSFVTVEVLGSGGGGGAGPVNGGSNAAVGAGGGAGGYAFKKVAAASLGTTETVTVGAAGAAGSTGSGGAGNTSSFGSHAVAAGGSGGSTRAGATSGVTAMTAGGTVSAGDIQSPGATGGAALIFSASSAIGGVGGNSMYGGGGVGAASNSSTDTSGSAATGYGAGGGGGINFDNTSAAAGGAGTAGLVIVKEYY